MKKKMERTILLTFFIIFFISRTGSGEPQPDVDVEDLTLSVYPSGLNINPNVFESRLYQKAGTLSIC
jgi:hypothetical protein